MSFFDENMGKSGEVLSEKIQISYIFMKDV